MLNTQKADVQKNDRSFAILMCSWKILHYIKSHVLSFLRYNYRYKNLFFPIVPAPIPCKAFGPDPGPVQRE